MAEAQNQRAHLRAGQILIPKNGGKDLSAMYNQAQTKTLTLTAKEIASDFFHKSLKTFQNTRAALEAIGFPRPLDIPGQPLWLASDIESWIKTRRDEAVAAAPKVIDTSAPAVQKKRGVGRPRKIAAAQQGGVA